MVCPRCGLENPHDARFCTNCGTGLQRGPLPGLEERKIVTAMFVRLTGSGGGGRVDADPEDVKALLRPFHERTSQEIERYGGTVDKVLGDEVFGVFGAPVAHEDDPERALWAAFRILREMDDLNESHAGVALRASIGINTGEAVVTYGAGPQVGESVTGDVVNTASRLQSAAPPGGILVGETTYRATRSRFVFDELEPVSVKGKAEPVAIWRPIEPRSQSAVAAHEAPHTPFVGREVELQVLTGVFQRAVREGSPQLVTITGEPGVGKSRLIGELFAYVDELTDVVAEWRQGRCPPYGEGVTFWALSEIVKARAGILETDSPEEATRKIEAMTEGVVEEGAEADWIAGRLRPLVGLALGDVSADADRTESFTAWRRFLEALALIRPLVLVFEDLHWAEPALLEFLNHLCDYASQVPLLVVCAARPELFEREPGWGGGKRNSTTIALGPLSRDETARLISALLDRAVLPAGTQTALLERAGGNPLYAEEFVHMLADRGILSPGRELSSEADIQVPDTVQALIAARLDTLVPERKALLQDAAVVGKTFWAAALAAIEDSDEPDVRAGLHEIARSELIRPHRTSRFKDEVEYSFWHLLVRDVAYGQIPRAARGAKHRAAGRWLEGIAGDRLADHAERLAYHYANALEIARAYGSPSGADDAELEETAVRFLIMAGDRSARLDVGRAETYYRRALELLPPGHERRGTALAKAAEATAAAGRFDEAERDYEAALEEFRGRGDTRSLGRTMALHARTLYRVADTPRAIAMSDEAVRILQDLPPGPELVLALTRSAGMSLLTGDNAKCLESAGRAVKLAEDLGLADEVVRARQFMGAARCELGERGGLDDLREAVRLGQELGLGEETAVAYENLGYQQWLYESPSAGLETWSSSIEFCHVRGFEAMAMWARAGVLENLLDLGEWDRALAESDRLMAWDSERGGTQHGVFAMVYRADVLVRRGLVDQAAALSNEFLPRARSVASAVFAAPALVVAAMIEMARGDGVNAAALAREFAEATGDRPGLRAHYLPDAMRTLVDAGQGEELAALVPAEEALATRRLNCLATAKAILAESEADFEAAEDLYAEAASRWESYGHANERALAIAGRARCLARLAREGQAEQQALLSAKLLTELGVPEEVGSGPGRKAISGLKH